MITHHRYLIWRNPQKQNGLVIVLVLGIVALMLTLLSFMIEKQQLMVRRLANQSVAEQGYQYAQGVNAWAERVLHDDQNRQVDYLGEEWAEFGKPSENNAEQDRGSFSLTPSSQNDEEEAATINFGIDDLEISIEDLQGRYNLNNIGNPNPAIRTGQRTIFLNLLETLGIDELDQRESLYGALLDWLDENDLSSPNGIESGEYTSRDTPYYAADQMLTSLGELRFVQGFTPEIITTLKPFVTVLPVDNARININTTSSEVMSSLSSSVVTDIGAVQAFLSQREDEGFLGFTTANIQQAISAIIQTSVIRQQPVTNMLQTNSQYFQINSKITLGDYVYCMRTTVLRESATPGGDTPPRVTVLNRQQDTLCEPQQEVAI